MLPAQMALFVKWSTTVIGTAIGGALTAYWANLFWRDATLDTRSIMLPWMTLIGVIAGAKEGLSLGRLIIGEPTDTGRKRVWPFGGL